ncbi:hypothetical protein CBR64_15405 [Cellulosimicrobium cellulans]|uniref:Lantibiotic dehydratase n=1 Tax=Cellulosimicrobium cellulans TaxID=1710 RepID=A0A1Y0HZP9_CELCE|nr:thiopeptide-type bacteriocin biosynthesis protein [Cellulosimicrobium cellulans]ARU52633.1 hypothetical protein CBR64_15405 [Cellulosimicrobium cellulans]
MRTDRSYENLQAPSPTVAVRCATLPVTRYPVGSENLSPLEHLRLLWSSSPLRESVAVSSPDLATRIEDVLSGRSEPSERRLERLRAGLLRFALRAVTRATPFGTFAGVADTDRSAGPLRLGSGHRRHVRVDPAVAQDLAQGEDVPLVPHPGLVVRGDRLVVPVRWGRRSGRATASSVRTSALVTQVMELCRDGLTRSELVARVVESGVPEAAAGRLVARLVDFEVLVPSAGRSMFEGLRQPGVPDDVVRALEGYATAPWGDGAAELAEAQAALRAAHGAAGTSTGSPHRGAFVHVDTYLDVRGAVPEDLVKAAAAVAPVLARVSPVPAPRPGVVRWAERFRERYGSALVPVLRAADPERGLGLPEKWDEPDPSDEADPERRRLLSVRASLLDRARRTGTGSVTLLDEDLRSLPHNGGWPSSYDLFVGLSQRDGRTVLTVTPVGARSPGGRGIGRFTLGNADLAERARTWAGYDRAVHAEAVVAELDCGTDDGALNVVGMTVALHAATLALTGSAGSREDDRRIRLDELFLGTVDEGSLGLFLGDGTPVELRQLTMLNTDQYAEIVRLLLEVGQSGGVAPRWSWGPVGGLVDYVPEVVYRGVVLSEQAWRWTGGRGSRDAVSGWLREAGLPRYVTVGDGDNRLHLDTEDPVHVDLLAGELGERPAWVHEAPPPERLGTIPGPDGDHAAELVVTLPTPDEHRARARRWSPRPVVREADDEARRLDIGKGWTYLTLKARRDRFDGLVRTLAAAAGARPWYFVRYDEQGHGQLRLRVNADLAALGDLFDVVARLRADGTVGEVAVRTFELELERYGGAVSFGIWQDAFCVESQALVAGAALRVRSSDDEPDYAFAAGLVEAWLSVAAPDPETADRVLELVDEGYAAELGPDVHVLRATARQHEARASDAAAALGEALREHWTAPSAVDAVRDATVVQSALHLFCNRLGLDRREEFVVLRIADRARRKERARAGSRAG